MSIDIDPAAEPLPSRQRLRSVATLAEASRPVLIVGGGIGGLALAIGLTRAGADVDVWERAPEYRSAGAGIALSVNAMAVLRALGTSAAIEAHGRVLQTFLFTDERARPLGRIDLSETERVHGPSIGIHRAALHQVLRGAARGARLYHNVTLASLEPRATHVTAVSSDGRRGDYALVVGADGIHSTVRALAFGPRAPQYSGYTCWRLVLPNEDGLTAACEMWGLGKRVGLVPIGHDELYVFATANAPRDASEPGDRVARFRARFAEFAGPVPSVLARVTSADQLLHNDIEEIWMPRWHQHRVVLLGDAAHAMTPNTGQGAAMALEDALSLCARLTTEPTVDAALAAYAAQRMSRVRSLHRASRRIGRVAQWQSPVACAIRNAAMRALPARASLRGVQRVIDAGVQRITADAEQMRSFPTDGLAE